MSQEDVSIQPALEEEQIQPMQPNRGLATRNSSHLSVKSKAFQPETDVPAGPFKHKGNTPRSRIPKQQSVTGHALATFGPEQVIVFNKGPVSVEFGYDGEDYPYPAGEMKTVSALIAFVHWGVIALVDPETNELHFSRPKGPGSQYEDRLSGYAPLTLWQKDPDAYEQFINWFSEGVEFKVFRPKTKIRQQEWNALGNAIS